jgi:dethiobiotin synthetase
LSGYRHTGPQAVLVITGTDTGVGKTVVAAAIAALAADAGQRVAVVKPVQTGVLDGEPGDMAEVVRLSGVSSCHELARYTDPLAPATAARRAALPTIEVRTAARVVDELSRTHDLVLVEGAGGLLVHLDGDGGTVADLAAGLHAPVLVVAAAGLGTLNATALTTEALRSRGLRCAGVVIGSWPAEPDLAASCNVADLPGYAQAPLLGALPAGAGELTRAQFLAVARRSLAPALGGRFDVTQLSVRPPVGAAH